MPQTQLDKTEQRVKASGSIKKRIITDTVIYLDNNATTPLDPTVLEEMLPYLTNNFGNPASTHSYGTRALYAVNNARSRVATAINASEDEIIFTSGATESNNFVIKGVFEHYRKDNPHFIVSNIEHKCILESIKHVEKLGAEVTILKVNSKGLIDPSKLKKAIRPNTVLVSIMFANNEIGSINPIRDLAQVCHDNNILFHSDAAQAVGKVPIDVHELGIDLLSASGHKLYGPKGIGFVYVDKDARKFLSPLLDGGEQESGLRSGTLNVPAIVGLGSAIELVTEKMNEELRYNIALRNRLYDNLKAAFPDLILNGTAIDSLEVLGGEGDLSSASSLGRLPNNLNITLPSVNVASIKNIRDVAFSSTSACSSNNDEPSYVLMAIGRSADEARASLRFGIGRFNTEADIVNALASITENLKP